MEEIYNIPQFLSQIYLSNSGYFFITLVIQNGTISSIFYFLRLDELFQNSLSPFVTYYKRYFVNNGKQWNRKEMDVFQFGYFYAQLLTFYSICLIFSSTVPILSVATLYFFVIRHLTDFISFLTVHRSEMDSNGNLINNILNFSWIPPLFYHLCMTSFFLVQRRYTAGIITLVVMFLSLLYFIIYFKTTYIFDIYSDHEKLKEYDHAEIELENVEITKWRY